MQSSLTPAYVLHSRPYRDTSALVDLLTLHHGMQRVVWRGARKPRSGAVAPQAFVPLLVATAGRGELKSLAQAEAAGAYLPLQGNALFSGLYLNELLVRLLAPGDPQTLIFAAYQSALQQLAETAAVEPVLRRFEWQLLEVMGYGFSLTEDAAGAPVEAEAIYVWHAEEGLLRLADTRPGDDRAGYSAPGLPGAGLLAMAREDWDAPQALRTAKSLMRQALAIHLGGRPLVSRQLFSSPGSTPRGDRS
ncbi:DNA repair protein RecO [Halopseudomonas sp.]|uniref:DNA repair protein RecO n=1 Tax=Halopseudomonas sp. TaxID=2901191 RepID=UPI003569B7C3